MSSASSLSSAFASANRGPLTIIFTPPASCLSETTLVSFLTTPSASTTGFTTTKIFLNHFSWGDPACYPSTIATIDGSTRWDNGYYYSPGICPSGWASACQQSTNALGFSTTIQNQTTAVICCPLNWTCVGGSTSLTGHGCSTPLFAGQTLTNVWPAPNPTPSVSLNLPTDRNLVTWEVPNNTSALCDAIPILWQNTDIQILSLLGVQVTQSSTIPTSSRSQFSSTIPTSTSITSATSTPTNKPRTISTGAKVAIGITIPIAMIALVLGIFFFFRKRNRRQVHHELPTSASNDGNEHLDWTRLSTLKKYGGDGKVSELHSDHRFEADPDHGISELESGARVVYEMPDTSANNLKGVMRTSRSSTPVEFYSTETSTLPPYSQR